MTKVKYNNSQKLAGIGMTPFYRAGPDKWFNDFLVISYYDWNINVNSPKVVSALREYPDFILDPLNTTTLVETKEYKELSDKFNFSEYKILTNKPVVYKDKNTYINDDQEVAKKFENKVWLREKLADRLNFPKFKIFHLDNLTNDQGLFEKLSDEFNTNDLVVQHEHVSGGRGTYFASSQHDLFEAYNKIIERRGVEANDKVVISARLEDPVERSIQCCITKYGVFIGPPQQQIVRNEDLMDPSINSSSQFCGGVIGEYANFDKSITFESIELIASEMEEAGYRGIFGVDFLVSNGELYVLEVNARITGMLPLLTHTQEDYPFLLLHLLELTDQDYEIEEDVDFKYPEKESNASFVIFSGFNHDRFPVKEIHKSGSYKIGDLEYISSNDLYINEIDSDSLMFQNYLSESAQVRPGARLGAILGYKNALDSKGNIEKNYLKLANKLNFTKNS